MKDAISNFCEFVLWGLCGSIGYILILKIFTTLKHVEMASYKGAAEIGVMHAVEKLFPNIIRTYTDTFHFYFEHDLIGNHFFNGAFVAIIVMLGIFIFVIKCSKLKKTDICLIAGLLFLLPIVANVINIIASDAILSVWAASGLYVLLPLFIMLTLHTLDNTVVFKRGILQIGLCSVTAILIWINMLQLSYDEMILENGYRQSMNIVEKIADDIDKEMEGGQEYEIAVIGAPELGNYPIAPLISKYGSNYAKEGLFWDVAFDSNRAWDKLLNEELQKKYRLVSYEEVKKIIASEEYSKMSNYPDEKSILKDGNRMIVKVSEMQ